MADDTNKDDAEKSVPSQIPLLEDVVEVKKIPRPRRRKQRDNYSLDLDPEPPRTRDLFEPDDGDASTLHEEDADPAPFIDDEPALSGTELDAVDESLLDEAVEAFEPESLERASPDIEAQLRAHADTVVDDLVREYSKEIIERLRQELTSLLDELNRDDET